MKNDNKLFCNDFFPVNDSYIYAPNNSTNDKISECQHCVHKMSHKCQDSVYQNPVFDLFG